MVQSEEDDCLCLQTPALLLLLLFFSWSIPVWGFSCFFFDRSSSQPCELALDLQLALHLGHMVSWFSKLLTYCGLALQFSVWYPVYLFLQYPPWPAGVSPESPFLLASQHWPRHPRSSFPCPCYQNHFLPCTFSTHSVPSWPMGVTQC